jgi:signal transduction histidine kinase
VSAGVAIALFRVLQEALENVQKHAGAQHVLVKLEATPSHYVLSIADDGRAAVPAPPPGSQVHEVAGMRHRMSAVGGSLWTGPAPAGGGEVRAVAPRVLVEGQPDSLRRDDLAEARSSRTRRVSGR